jgi:transglycosylase, SLT domain protein
MKYFLIIAAFVIFTGTSAHADVFDAPCSRYRVPKRLVLAIAKTESGLDPWCVNVAGKTYRPGSRAGALAVIRQARHGASPTTLALCRSITGGSGI